MDTKSSGSCKVKLQCRALAGDQCLVIYVRYVSQFRHLIPPEPIFSRNRLTVDLVYDRAEAILETSARCLVV